MGTAFWIRRFCQVLGGAFVVIAGSHLLRGRGLHYALSEGAVWAIVSACVFTGARLYHSRRGQTCAICRDTPEFRQTGPRG